MKRTRALRLGCVAALVALLSAGCGSSRTVSAHEPRGSKHQVERAFVQLLAKGHPGFRGSTKCPSVRAARQEGRPACVGEIHKGREYVQVWAWPALRSGHITFEHVSTGSWVRRWSKYAPPPQGISPGLISVNGNGGYDWRWLLLGVDYECRQKHRDSCSAGALDGPWPGWVPFFTFHCTDAGRLITCRNKVGDAVRWLPHAHSSPVRAEPAATGSRSR